MMLLRHELLKLFARKRSYIGFAVFLIVQITILLLLQLPKAKAAVSGILSSNGYPFEPFYGGLTLAVLIIVFTFSFLGALYIALVGGDIVAKEVEEGTMRLILARPVSRVRLILIKWLACSIYTITLVLFLATTALITATFYSGKLGQLFVMEPRHGVFGIFSTSTGLGRFVLAMLAMALATQVISNMALMFSCFPMKPAAATVLTLSVLFADLVLQAIPYFHDYRYYFVTFHTSFWVRVFQPNMPYWDIGASIAFLMGLNLTFILIGTAVFATRNIKQ